MGVSLKKCRVAGRPLLRLTAVSALCRSVYASYSGYFCRAYTDGTANNSNANNSRGVAPGFYKMGQMQ